MFILLLIGGDSRVIRSAAQFQTIGYLRVIKASDIAVYRIWIKIWDVYVVAWYNVNILLVSFSVREGLSL